MFICLYEYENNSILDIAICRDSVCIQGMTLFYIFSKLHLIQLLWMQILSKPPPHATIGPVRTADVSPNRPMYIWSLQEWIRLIAHGQRGGPVMLSARIGSGTLSQSFCLRAGHNVFELFGILSLNSSSFCFYSCLSGICCNTADVCMHVI